MIIIRYLHTRIHSHSQNKQNYTKTSTFPIAVSDLCKCWSVPTTGPMWALISSLHSNVTTSVMISITLVISTVPRRIMWSWWCGWDSITVIIHVSLVLVVWGISRILIIISSSIIPPWCTTFTVAMPIYSMVIGAAGVKTCDGPTSV